MEASDIRVGDTLVMFTPAGGYIVTPPTDRQLTANRTTWTYVTHVIPTTTPHGYEVLDFGVGPMRPTSLPTAKIWRVRRG